MQRGQSPSKLIPPYCSGCIYRSANKTFPCCDFLYLTGNARGCDAGPGCIHKTSHYKQTRSRNDIAIKPKRVKLTDEERREHRNALRRRERADAKKKAASDGNLKAAQ